MSKSLVVALAAGFGALALAAAQPATALPLPAVAQPDAPNSAVIEVGRRDYWRRP
jgi:hypothetical protein